MIDSALVSYFMVFFWVFIIGLCFGSFLNVVILRGLSGESIVFPSSKCPVCKNKLKWWMNIPVLSYLLLKGKCGFCKTHISKQYPIVEFICGVFFLIIFIQFGFSINTIFYFIAFFMLMAMSVCDIKENVILDFHAYILIAAGIILNSIISGFDGFLFGLIGAVIGFIIYEIIARLGFFVAGQRAFGEGDSLIAAGIGAYFGTKLMGISVLLSILVMAVFTFPYFFYYCVKSGKTRTVAGLSASIITIVISYIVNTLNLLKTFVSTMIFLAFIIGVIIWCLKQILNDINKVDENGERNLCILPFGPAMAVSFILIMLYKNEILNIVGQHFS